MLIILLIYRTNSFTLDLKNKTYFYAKREPIVCILQIIRLLSLQFCLRMTLQIYGGKRSALFCCHGRIEIKYLFLWLLQNNLLDVEMLFEIQKPQLFCFKQHSYTPQSLFHNRHENACYISLKHVTPPP